MKIVTTCKNKILQSTPLRIALRHTLYFGKKIRYALRGIGVQRDEKLVMFGAYNGRSYVCTPKAVYEYMVSSGRYPDYHFVWMFDHPEEHRDLEKNPNTTIVKSQSAACEKYLHQAKYWIFNFRAMDQWIPAADQVYVQCWHGTPLKRLGYDITNSDNAMNSVAEIQEKYRTDTQRFDYLLSPCRFSSEKFRSAWHLDALGKSDAILEIGYPRNDFLSTYTQEDVQRVKERLGLGGTTKKIILYAPTWRDNQHDAASGYVYQNPVDFDQLRAALGEEYIILFRAHYLVANSFDFEAYKGFVYDVSGYDDINELYILADLLVTDYSSVFFDYAILERPMIFYMYDMEEYRDEMRGFYLDVSELPGPIVRTEEELAQAVHHADSAQNRAVLEAFNAKFNYLNDGKAAQRLAEKVIGEPKRSEHFA